MRRPLLPIVVVGLSLLALLWGFGAFMGPYPGRGPWGMTGPPRHVARIWTRRVARIWSRCAQMVRTLDRSKSDDR
jgi:hypothetical protein